MSASLSHDTRGARTWWALLAVLLSACGPDDGTPPTELAVDSAGIRIVTHTSPPAGRMSIGEEPLVRIGVSPDQPALFGVVGGRLLGDGRLLIADAGNHRFLVLERSGRVRGSLGGRGEGPGEFLNIGWLQMIDGGIVAYDSRARRVTRLSLTGEVVSTLPFRPDRPDPPSDDALWVGGSVLAVTSTGMPIGYPAAFADPRGREGPLDLTAELAVFDSLGVGAGVPWRVTLMEMYEDPDGRIPVASRLGAGRIHWRVPKRAVGHGLARVG